MRILLLCGFLALLAVGLLAQQTPHGTGTPIAPRTSVSPQRSENSTLRTADPSTPPPPPNFSYPVSPLHRPLRVDVEPPTRSALSRSKAIAEDNPKTPPTTAPYRPQRSGDGTAPAVVQWLSWEGAIERSKTEKRKIFVDIYTDWCGWCKRMDTSTLSDSAVVSYLNEKYYAVKFNAETPEEITFRNKTYSLRRDGQRSYHELAIELLSGRVGFPTLVFLDENFQVIQSIPGYQPAEHLLIILSYFATDSHKTTPWEVYERRFNQHR